MTKTYDNELKGVLFKNEDKEQDSHPDYRGNAQIEGIGYFMDAWINTAESGRKYMSFRFKKKEKQASAPAGKPAASKTAKTSTGFDDMDDDIPF